MKTKGRISVTKGTDADDGDADSDAYDEPYRRTKRKGETLRREGKRSPGA